MNKIKLYKVDYHFSQIINAGNKDDAIDTAIEMISDTYADDIKVEVIDIDINENGEIEDIY